MSLEALVFGIKVVMDLQSLLASLGAISIAFQLIRLLIPRISAWFNFHFQKRLNDYAVNFIKSFFLDHEERFALVITQLINQNLTETTHTILQQSPDNEKLLRVIKSHMDVHYGSTKTMIADELETAVASLRRAAIDSRPTSGALPAPSFGAGFGGGIRS